MGENVKMRNRQTKQRRVLTTGPRGEGEKENRNGGVDVQGYVSGGPAKIHGQGQRNRKRALMKMKVRCVPLLPVSVLGTFLPIEKTIQVCVCVRSSLSVSVRFRVD